MQAKPDTVDKVCKIVRKQLALADDYVVNGESKFQALGADSLDTVCILSYITEFSFCSLVNCSYMFCLI